MKTILFAAFIVLVTALTTCHFLLVKKCLIFGAFIAYREIIMRYRIIYADENVLPTKPSRDRRH